MLHHDPSHRLYHFENDERQAKLALVLTAVMAIVTAVLIAVTVRST